MTTSTPASCVAGGGAAATGAVVADGAPAAATGAAGGGGAGVLAGAAVGATTAFGCSLLALFPISRAIDAIASAGLAAPLTTRTETFASVTPRFDAPYIAAIASA